MIDNKIGYAVLGLGVGRAHCDAVNTFDDAALVAICDIDEKRLSEAGEDYEGTLLYNDFNELIKNKDIDIISICLPSGIHAEYTVKALEAGYHVLVEKPIDITVEAAMRIEEARVRTGKTVGCVFQTRNNACFKKALEVQKSGRAGKIFLGDFSVKWYRPPEYFTENTWRGTWEMDGGGSLMNQAIHTVDLMLQLMGEPEYVFSEKDICTHRIKTEDLTVSLIKFKSGARATLSTTTCAYPGVATEISFYGENGTVEIKDECIVTWEFRDCDDDEKATVFEQYGHGNAIAAKYNPGYLFGHESVVRDMIDAVKENRNPQVMPLDAIKSVKLIEAIYRSSNTGKKVYL